MEGFVCKQTKGLVVTPVSTSLIAGAVAEENGCEVEFTPVGSIYVARQMRKLIAAGKPVAFGGEGNGGLIYPEHQFCRDGGMTAAMMVGLLHAAGAPLAALLDAMPAYQHHAKRRSGQNLPRCHRLLNDTAWRRVHWLQGTALAQTLSGGCKPYP